MEVSDKCDAAHCSHSSHIFWFDGVRVFENTSGMWLQNDSYHNSFVALPHPTSMNIHRMKSVPHGNPLMQSTTTRFARTMLQKDCSLHQPVSVQWFVSPGDFRVSVWLSNPWYNIGQGTCTLTWSRCRFMVFPSQVNEEFHIFNVCIILEKSASFW